MSEKRKDLVRLTRFGLIDLEGGTSILAEFAGMGPATRWTIDPNELSESDRVMSMNKTKSCIVTLYRRIDVLSGSVRQEEVKRLRGNKPLILGIQMMRRS